MEFDITNPAMLQSASNTNANAWNGLSFVAVEDSTIKYNASAVTSAEYSTDLQTWNDANGVVIPLNAGQKVFFRGSINGVQDTEADLEDIAHFEMTGKIQAKGSITSMGEMQPYCYFGLFAMCKSLITPPKLPATALSEGCYCLMFYLCEQLAEAPELPATTLSKRCYHTMFAYCLQLDKAPNLPATTLSEECYAAMFTACANLTEAPELPATKLEENCYQGMFAACEKLQRMKCLALDELSKSYTEEWVYNVSPNGTFIKNAAATWENTFGDDAIPTGWTVETANE